MTRWARAAAATFALAMLSACDRDQPPSPSTPPVIGSSTTVTETTTTPATAKTTTPTWPRRTTPVTTEPSDR
jgi:hypothetical protein